jgi:5-methylthioadenosine/S-adenosylhomocysteine deaminase
LLERGVNVALGSDGAGGQPINLFEQAKLAMLLSRVSELDCDRWIYAAKALKMATSNGGAVMGEEGKIGVVCVGARADLVVIRMDNQTYSPLGDIWSHLVMYESGSSVDTVIVDGQIVVRQGRCTRFDEEELLAEANEIARSLPVSPNNNGAAAVVEERPVFKAAIMEALNRQATINRFAALV